MKRKAPILMAVMALGVAGLLFALTRPPREMVLTGIVTTDEVMVSAEILGRVQRLLVKEGDATTNGQLLAVIQPQEWKADVAFYTSSLEQSGAQVAQAEADLKYQEAQTSSQIRQAEATLASTEAQWKEAQADLENARLSYKRVEDLFQLGVDSRQAYDQARTTHEAARAHVDSVEKQVQAAQAAVALAKSNEVQIAARRAALEATVHQRGAANAQKEKANVRLDYTQVRAPMAGTVDTRTALEGEVVNPGQVIVTLI